MFLNNKRINCPTKKAVVLLSGGMDSLLTLAVAIEKKYEPLALHINYSQNTQKKELQSFNNICDFYKISNENRLILDIEYLVKIGGTSLINNVSMSNETNASNEKSPSGENLPATYVPFRNGNMLAIAASWAERTNSNAIFIGVSEVDFSGYPDCRGSFLRAFEIAVNEGTGEKTAIKIEAPLLSMTKADIVKLGMKLKIPFENSWSCYFAEDAACGECESCKLRLQGFASAGFNDPIKYLI